LIGQWFRVFGASDKAVEPAALLEHLQANGFAVTGRFRGDDLGWFAAELLIADDTAVILLERYLAREEGIRPELNSWAAWLETHEGNPHHERLMQQVIATTQLFTLHQPIENVEDHETDDDMETLCLTCCRYLAAATDGVYQADHRGFFNAEGTLLVPETT
jgi:hypothetical protein